MSIDDLMTRLNPLLGAVLRSPVHWPLSSALVLLHVTGRRSGRCYTIPVGYQREGDILFVMVSEAPKKSWFRNYLKPAALELTLRGRRRRGRAAVVAPNSEEFRTRAETTLERVPGMARVFKVDFDRRAGLSAEQIRELGGEIAVVRIALEGEVP